MQDLRRLAKEVEDAHSKALGAKLAELDSEASQLNNNDTPESPSPASIDIQLRRARIEERHDFRVELSEESVETTGSAEEMFQELDRRTVRGIAFYGGDSERHSDLAVRFARFPIFTSSPAVLLRVTSTDVAWARSTFAHLSDEIDKGRPWWAWVNRDAGVVVLHTVTAMVLLVAASLALFSRVSLPPDELTATILALGVACFLVPLVVTNRRVRQRMFPPFEITESARSTGTGVLVYILTLLASIVIGVWVNIIS